MNAYDLSHTLVQSRQGCPLLDTPRTDSGVPNSGTGLPPRMLNGKMPVGLHMKDSRAWEPGVSDPWITPAAAPFRPACAGV
jgi:hypothetical protein